MPLAAAFIVRRPTTVRPVRQRVAAPQQCNDAQVAAVCSALDTRSPIVDR
jgi:hypothetical protein